MPSVLSRRRLRSALDRLHRRWGSSHGVSIEEPFPGIDSTVDRSSPAADTGPAISRYRPLATEPSMDWRLTREEAEVTITPWRMPMVGQNEVEGKVTSWNGEQEPADAGNTMEDDFTSDKYHLAVRIPGHIRCETPAGPFIGLGEEYFTLMETSVRALTKEERSRIMARIDRAYKAKYGFFTRGDLIKAYKEEIELIQPHDTGAARSRDTDWDVSAPSGSTTTQGWEGGGWQALDEFVQANEEEQQRLYDQAFVGSENPPTLDQYKAVVQLQRRCLNILDQRRDIATATLNNTAKTAMVKELQITFDETIPVDRLPSEMSQQLEEFVSLHLSETSRAVERT